jgi:hypothetical protein
MANRRTAVTVIGLALCFGANLAQGDVFVYPKPGQTQDQVDFDQFQCQKWATQQTGVNPAQAQPTGSASAPSQGGAIKGAAGGAALGAAGGAIAGNAGKGAAIGAGVGAALGLMSQSSKNSKAAQQQQQAQSQQNANLGRFDQAYRTCLAGRGYQIR